MKHKKELLWSLWVLKGSGGLWFLLSFYRVQASQIAALNVYVERCTKPGCWHDVDRRQVRSASWKLLQFYHHHQQHHHHRQHHRQHDRSHGQ